MAKSEENTTNEPVKVAWKQTEEKTPRKENFAIAFGKKVFSSAKRVIAPSNRNGNTYHANTRIVPFDFEGAAIPEEEEFVEPIEEPIAKASKPRAAYFKMTFSLIHKLIPKSFFKRKTLIKFKTQPSRLQATSFKRAVQEMRNSTFIGDDAPELEFTQNFIDDSSDVQIAISSIHFLEIGRGLFATIHKAIFQETTVAVKMYMPANDESTEVEYEKSFIREVELLRNINNKNIVNVYGYSLKPKPLVIMEYCNGGSLRDIMQHSEYQYKFWDFMTVKNMMISIAEGMAFLHDLKPKVIHRDLRLANIFVVVEEDGCIRCKIGDFNLSRHLHAPSVLTECGTYQWVAPEIVKEETASEKVDIYSFAMVMWEIVHPNPNQFPFEDHEGGPMLASMQAAFYGLRPSLEDCTYPQFIPCIKACWTEDPTERPSAAKLVKMLKKIKESGEVGARRSKSVPVSSDKSDPVRKPRSTSLGIAD
ncbi:hypothetical protein CYMTET_17370 [Cymbomonas tetramitiformis]|uniref:Protein kinase domain-containing protein n=1 Tax=Cymbomonas tetramitiformis TaxID=36881 RepID=A0AAE0GBN2_9CHLO|nr:hypothetical protein CYMTET_17370 [Cymbomonas tetramitiformis]